MNPTENHKVPKKYRLLTGKENYVGWHAMICTNLIKKGFATENKGTLSFTEGKEEDAFRLIQETLSLEAIGKLSCVMTTLAGNMSPQRALSRLATLYGPGNQYDLRRDFEKLKNRSEKTPINLIGDLEEWFPGPALCSPINLIGDLEELARKLLLSGEYLTPKEKFYTLCEGLAPDFAPWVRSTRLETSTVAELDEEAYERITKSLISFHAAAPTPRNERAFVLTNPTQSK